MTTQEVLEQWLTRKEVAARWQMPESTLAQWPARNKGPKFARFGKHVRYRMSDVKAWEEAQFDGGAA